MVLTLISSQLITKLQDYFKNSRTTIRNFIIAIIVWALERAFEKGVFKCPSSKYFAYGIVFIIGPAVCLFNLTILLNGSLWDVITGCTQVRYSRGWLFKKLIKHSLQALLPPCVWLVVALLHTHYYVCAKLGPKEVTIRRALLRSNGTITKEQAKERTEELFTLAGAESQIIAWCLLVGLVVLATMAVCIRRCCFLRTSGSLPYIEQYEKLESKAVVAEFKILMDEQAKKAGKEYVMGVFETFKEKDAFNRVQETRKQIAQKYPRATGNLSLPYRSIEMETENELKPLSNGYNRMNSDTTEMS